MIKQKIFIWILLLITTASIKPQTTNEESSKTILWGLFKVPNDKQLEKVPIYDKIFRYREFATPIHFMPIEIRYGLGVNGKLSGSTSSPSASDLDNWIWFDSKVTPLDQGIENIIGTSLDVDVGMINIPNLVMKTSWMNVLTGLNYRSSSIISPKNIPSDWKNGTILDTTKIKFKPEVTEYLISNSLQWQPFDSWYLNFRYGYGLAFSKFYYNGESESIMKAIKGRGTSMNVGIGFRYIIDTGKLNRFSIGVDLRHSYTKINKIDDPNSLTPVNRFDLANYGLYFTLSTFYGGVKTVGDEAKTIYYKGDYLTAKSKFKDFITNYPTHSNKYRALEFLEKCNKKIPYQVMEEGLYYDDIGDSEKALEKYIQARSKVITNDSLIVQSLNFRINEIARKWINSAEVLLDKGFYKDALNLIEKVSSFYQLEDNVINEFKSFVILEEGKKLQSILIIGKAMEKYSTALRLNENLDSKIKALQYQAGIQLIEILNHVDTFDEIVLAVQSLEEAKKLSSSIGSKNEQLLKDLKKKLESFNDYKAGFIIDSKMSQARYLQAIARRPRLTIGMTLPLVEELLGEPHEIIISNNLDENEQLWVYFLKLKRLELSFKDFILFKIEET